MCRDLRKQPPALRPRRGPAQTAHRLTSPMLSARSTLPGPTSETERQRNEPQRSKSSHVPLYQHEQNTVKSPGPPPEALFLMFSPIGRRYFLSWIHFPQAAGPPLCRSETAATDATEAGGGCIPGVLKNEAALSFWCGPAKNYEAFIFRETVTERAVSEIFLSSLGALFDAPRGSFCLASLFP